MAIYYTTAGYRSVAGIPKYFTFDGVSKNDGISGPAATALTAGCKARPITGKSKSTTAESVSRDTAAGTESGASAEKSAYSRGFTNRIAADQYREANTGAAKNCLITASTTNATDGVDANLNGTTCCSKRYAIICTAEYKTICPKNATASKIRSSGDTITG